jgi:hypothetical protein
MWDRHRATDRRTDIEGPILTDRSEAVACRCRFHFAASLRRSGLRWVHASSSWALITSAADLRKQTTTLVVPWLGCGVIIIDPVQLAMNPAADRQVYNTLATLGYLMGIISPGSDQRKRLIDLMNSHPSADPASMGFPNDWKTLPAWK